MIKEQFSCVRDGKTIRGVTYRPEGKELPAVILSHGFMSSYRKTAPIAEKLAGMGFAAIAYDFCGGGNRSRSDGKTVDMSVLTEKEDLKAVIEAVSALPYVKSDDISLLGCSQGGLVSSLVAADLGDRIKRIILFYPALCVPDDARKGQMITAKFDPKNVPETFRCGFMKLGRMYAADVMDMDPFSLIVGYKGPVLILHGSKDEIVDVSYAKRAYKSYLASRGGVPDANCQLVLIDGANHGFHGLQSKGWNDYVFFAIEKFLEGKAPILDIDVNLTKVDEEKLAKGKHVKIWFDAHAESPYFTGDNQPGCFDDQIRESKKSVECHARYTLEGEDYTGSHCTVSIHNAREKGETKSFARGWKPTVSTTSEALGFLNSAKCETYAEMRKKGPFIHIFADPTK